MSFGIMGAGPKFKRLFSASARIAVQFFGLLLFVQSVALPVHIGFFMLPPDASTMTHGCKTSSCCTPLCYLDENGVHHCVHMPGAVDFCECNFSTDHCDANPVFLSAIVCFCPVESALPAFIPDRLEVPFPEHFRGHEPTTPKPPPK